MKKQLQMVIVATNVTPFTKHHYKKQGSWATQMVQDASQSSKTMTLEGPINPAIKLADPGMILGAAPLHSPHPSNEGQLQVIYGPMFSGTILQSSVIIIIIIIIITIIIDARQQLDSSSTS
uniref:Uncharacterized protein n=1 Tax=Plectus sambesii TaxID=2011161 RepID=A0A914XHY2_9BILA